MFLCWWFNHKNIDRQIEQQTKNNSKIEEQTKKRNQTKRQTVCISFWQLKYSEFLTNRIGSFFHHFSCTPSIVNFEHLVGFLLSVFYLMCYLNANRSHLLFEMLFFSVSIPFSHSFSFQFSSIAPSLLSCSPRNISVYRAEHKRISFDWFLFFLHIFLVQQIANRKGIVCCVVFG